MLPLVLGPLGVEAVSAHPFASDPRRGPLGPARVVDEAKRLVGAVGADLGVVFDRAGERLYLVDERGGEVPVEQALLLYLRLLARTGRTGKLAFPVTVTSQVDWMVGEALSRSSARRPRSPA